MYKRGSTITIYSRMHNVLFFIWILLSIGTIQKICAQKKSQFQKKKQVLKSKIKKINIKNQLTKFKTKKEVLKKKYVEIKNNTKRRKLLNKKNVDKEFSNKELLLAKKFALNKGHLPFPVKQGSVVNYFGKQPYPGLEGVFIDNVGIDIRTPKGAKAKSVFEGTIREVYLIKGEGKALLIKHGNYYTVYSNLQKVYLHKGDKVKKNQDLGEICTNPKGNTFLNFQIWHNIKKEDPLHWIKDL